MLAVEVNLTEKIHSGEELKEIINVEGVGHEGITGKNQCKDPVVSSL